MALVVIHFGMASMTLVRALASYLVDFYNPPKQRTAHWRESRLSKRNTKLVENVKKKRGGRAEKTRRYPKFCCEISKLIKHIQRVKTEKSVWEILFENYAKKYGTENFTMRELDDFQNSVIAVTTAKFALFNIQVSWIWPKKVTLDMKTWGRKNQWFYLVIPDNGSTFPFLSALFFQPYFKPLTRQADIDFKGQLPLHVRVYLDEFINIGEIPDFAEQTSTVRSRNMSLVLFYKYCLTSRAL